MSEELLEEERKEFEAFLRQKEEPHKIMARAAERLSGKEVKGREVFEEIETWFSPSKTEKELEEDERKKFEKLKREGKLLEAEKFLYYSEDFEKLMNFFGHAEVKPLYGKEQIGNIKEVKKFKQIKDQIERLKFLQTLELPDAIACVYSIEDKFGYQRIQKLKKRLSLYLDSAQRLDYCYYSESLEENLKCDILRHASFGTPEMEIYQKAYHYLLEDGVEKKHLVPLSGRRSGVHSYEFLREIFNEALGEVKKRSRGRDLSPDELEKQATVLGAKWLRKSMEYNDPNEGRNSPFVGSYKEALAWARLTPAAQKQLLFLRRNVAGKDLHNIGRFVGKGKPNEALEKRYFGARSIYNKLVEDPERERPRIMADLTAINDEKFERKLAKLERDEAKDAKEIWEKTSLKDEAKELLAESADHFAEKRRELAVFREKEITRLQNLSDDEIIEIYRAKSNELWRRSAKAKPLAEKALELESLAHLYRHQFSLKTDWLNSAPFGLINRCYQMHLATGSPKKVLSYVQAYEILGKDLENYSGQQLWSLIGMAPELLRFVKNSKTYRVEDLERLIDDPETFADYARRQETFGFVKPYVTFHEQIRRLQEFSGLKIEWNEDRITREIERIVKNSSFGGEEVLEGFDYLEKAMGKKIPWTQSLLGGVVEKFCIQRRDFNIAWIEKRAGLKMNWGQVDIDAAGSAWLLGKGNLNALNDIERLERLAKRKVVFSREAVNEKGRELLFFIGHYAVAHEGVDLIRKLEELSGNKVEWRQEDLDAFGHKLLDENNLEGIRDVLLVSGKNINWRQEKINEGGTNLLYRSFQLISEMETITGLKVEWQQEEIDLAGFRILSFIRPDQDLVAKVAELELVTGRKVSWPEEQTQKTLDDFLRAGKLDVIRQFEALTQSQRSWKQETVDSCGGRLLAIRNFDGIRALEVLTRKEVRFEREEVERVGYGYLADRNINFLSSRLEDSTHELEELTHQKIQWDQNRVNQVGNEMLVQGKYNSINTVGRMTKLQVQLSQQAINRRGLLLLGASYFHEIKTMENELSRSVEWEQKDIDNAGQKYFRNDDYGRIRELEDVTKMKMRWSQEIIDSKGAAYLAKSDFRYVNDLERISGRKVHWNQSQIDEIAKRLLCDGKFNSISSLKGATNMTINWSRSGVDAAGDNCLARGSFFQISIMEKETGLRPNFTQVQIDETGERLISKECSSDTIEEFEKEVKMKVRFTQHMIDRAGQALIVRYRFDLVRKLPELTGFKPNFEAVKVNKVAYTLSIDSAFAEKMRNLEETTGLRVYFSEDYLAGILDSHGFYALHRLLPEKEMKERTAEAGIMSFVFRAFKIQAPAEKEEYCPWRTDLRELTREALNNRVFNPLEVKDREVFLRYLKDFGPVNCSRLFRFCLELDRVESSADLSEESRDLVRTFGVSIEKLPRPSEILNELKRLKRQMISKLLADEAPSNLDTVLGAEIFKSLRGYSRWNAGETLSELLKNYVTERKNHPELFAIPAGYEVKEFKIRKAVLSEEQKSVQADKLAEFWQEKTTKEALANNIQPLAAALSFPSRRVEAGTWWETIKDEELNEAASKMAAKLRANLEKVPEKAKAGAEKQIKDAEDFLTFLEEYHFSENPAEEDFLRAMEAFTKVPLKGQKEIQNALYVLAAYHLFETMPEGQSAIIRELLSDYPETSSEKLVAALDAFVTEYLLEHYFDPVKDPVKTNHLEFSSDLFKTLKGVFGLTGDVKKRPVRLLAERAAALTKGEAALGGETVNVRLVPNKGLLRVYAGEMSDACYAKYAGKFSSGDFPNITALVFDTNPGTPHERFDGAALLIETETENGEKSILVRANNPMQRLLNAGDKNQLIKETLDYAIDAAEKKGFDFVVVPLSAAPRASSNRKDVSDYYFKNYGTAEKIGLRNEAATNFNDYYQVWNKNGLDPCVVIWRKNKK